MEKFLVVKSLLDCFQSQQIISTSDADLHRADQPAGEAVMTTYGWWESYFALILMQSF